MYAGVPAPPAASCASPKSTRRARPSPISTLSGLTSRWTSPARCTAASPAATWCIARTTSRAGRLAPIHARSGTPGASSITTCTAPSTSPASCTATTLGCASFASARPTRSTPSPPCTTLTATRRSSRGSYAANTVPLAPRPSRASITSRPSRTGWSPPNSLALTFAASSSSTRSRTRSDYTARVRDDADLLAAWRGGDLAAGNELVTRHWPAGSRVFGSKIGDVGAALISQTLLACVESREPVDNVKAFIFAVARRRLVDHFRKVARAPELDPALSSVADLATGVETGLDRAREHELLRDALVRIPLDDQIALELAYREGRSGRDLARVLDVAENTVRSRLARAKDKLRAQLVTLGTPD